MWSNERKRREGRRLGEENQERGREGEENQEIGTGNRESGREGEKSRERERTSVGFLFKNRFGFGTRSDRQLSWEPVNLVWYASKLFDSGSFGSPC